MCIKQKLLKGTLMLFCECIDIQELCSKGGRQKNVLQIYRGWPQSARPYLFLLGTQLHSQGAET